MYGTEIEFDIGTIDAPGTYDIHGKGGLCSWSLVELKEAIEDRPGQFDVFQNAYSEAVNIEVINSAMDD